MELEFIRWVTSVLWEVRELAGPEVSEVRDQLDRALLSAPSNTAEGNGKRIGRSRYQFFHDARGSATECPACLDALVAKVAASDDRVAEGKTFLLCVVQMLSKMIDPSEKPPGVREDRSDYGFVGTTEDDDEHD